jgi:hypothetical protein
MTIRGLLITTTVVGTLLGVWIDSPWLIVVPLSTALVFGPQSIVIAVMAYLATREPKGALAPGRKKRSGTLVTSPNGTSTEITYLESLIEPVDATGIVFQPEEDSARMSAVALADDPGPPTVR